MTFSMVRWLMRLPDVARRSPAITTPSLKRTATHVVAWGTTRGWDAFAMGTSRTPPTRCSNAAKLGPGSSPGEKKGIDIGAQAIGGVSAGTPPPPAGGHDPPGTGRSRHCRQCTGARARPPSRRLLPVPLSRAGEVACLALRAVAVAHAGRARELAQRLEFTAISG